MASITLVGGALAHPGSSIGVSRDGRVFFADTGGGVVVVESGGKLRYLEGPALHWFALDESSNFAQTRWPAIPGAQIVSVGRSPTLVLSSDFPVTIGGDGAFYYPWFDDGKRWRIMRVAPSGARSVHASTTIRSGPDGAVGWINGLAAGGDGSLYFTHDRSVHRIDARGAVTTIVENVRVTRCARIPGVEANAGAYLRGLDVAPNGTVYVAASGCGAVLMIDAKGTVTPVLRTISPYSPTAVAVSGGEIFVLEYLHTDSDNREEWIPRVRKITRAGQVETLVSRTR